MAGFEYPHPRRDDNLIEDFFGTKVADPYRWMEDPDAEETKTFVEAQNGLSRQYFESYEKRELINKKLTNLWNYPKTGVPHREGNRYYFSKNDGLQNQWVIYVQDTLDSEPRVFFDANELAEDGTISMTSDAFSEDGKLWAYCLSTSGANWLEAHFMEVETGKKFDEVLKKVKFTSLSWTHDNKGVFYGAYPDHETEATGRDTTEHDNHKLLYHRIGTPQSQDVLVVEFPDNPKWRIGQEVSDCGRYLIVTSQVDCRDNLVYFSDLEALPKDQGIQGKLKVTQIIFEFKHDYEYVTNYGSKCVFRTDQGAPNYQLVCIDLEQDRSGESSEPWSMTPLIPEKKDDVLEWATCVAGNFLMCCYLRDVKNVVHVHDLVTGDFKFELPLNIGSIVGFSGKKKSTEIFYKFSSMIDPGITYYLDMLKLKPKPKVFHVTKISGYDCSKYMVDQIFYKSKDGTDIPMFIVSKKNEQRNGNSPCLLYGYGGFNISLTPRFSVTQLFFVRHFGYLAIPNIRGGGEYGERWHDGGRLLNKQNVFDDFQSAAEFLIREKYTCKEKLAIKGGSNGGLLVGACLNQRPDLFGAGIAATGVMDMLRFHKFTIGYAWCSDYGNPDKKEHFENLFKFSPLHNVRPPHQASAQYPAVLLTTYDHDDRVVPSHTLKLIAQLQHIVGSLHQQTNPLMVRIETKAGHCEGRPTSKLIEEITDMFSFLAKALNYEFVEED